MCLGALASQTGGSITRPASYCGVSACKPTYGAANVQGVLPLAESMDHVGAMANCVGDVALIMQSIMMTDLNRSLVPYPPDGGGEPPILGRLRGFFDRHSDESVSSAMEQQCSLLASAGARLRNMELPASFEEVVPRHRVIMAVEAAAYHQERLARHPNDYPPCIRQLLAEGIACPAPEYARCKDHQRRLTADMSELLSGVDALVCPATNRSAPDAATTGDPMFNSPWSYTGLPVVSFPIARAADGLPLSLQLVGAANDEARLFRVAAWCEQVLCFTLGPPTVVANS
jgi:aspartyl-tRNA(Asn)/glutamyl-tRNA(Gln) amidotransferase subunit A